MGPVVVVGAGLAGLAAAARLAKLGHAVVLYEREGRVGGTWAPHPYAGVLVDDAPQVLGFPAPWRDLFRKSGRPLEAELARSGYRLAPAPPSVFTFAGGDRLELPTDRGEQWSVLSARYGPAPAARWRDLLDRLDEVWQTLRALGLEAEPGPGRRLPRAARRGLLGSRATLADLAADLRRDELTALVRSVAHRAGSTPELTPAHAAVEWSVHRRFGRWEIRPEEGRPGDPGRSSVLVEALAERLRLRRVDVRTGVVVRRLVASGGRVSAVVTDEGETAAAAVVATGDPWRTVADLLPVGTLPRTARGLRRLRPARSPLVRHRLQAPETPDPPGAREVTDLDVAGVPTVHACRPVDGGSLVTVTAYDAGPARAAYGAAWNGLGRWLDRPRVTTELPGLFLAGPWSPGGSGASQVVLSGALASYACDGYLSAR